MIYLEIKYSKQALKFLKKQDSITQKHIINAISKIPQEDIKTLQGASGVIFDYIDSIIFIKAIGNRGQIYKGV